MNELNINECTVSKLCITDVAGTDRYYVLSLRSGATVDMAVDTVLHYLHALAVASGGKYQAREDEGTPENDRRNRIVYSEPLQHGEARVNIFSKEWVHPNADYQPVVNNFNEFTSAQALLDMLLTMNHVVEALASERVTTNPLKKALPKTRPIPIRLAQRANMKIC